MTVPMAQYLVCALLLCACWTDVTRLVIPNWIPAAIAALFVFPAVRLTGVEIGGHALAAAGVFAVGFGLFAAGKIGGGDVKLITALALWTGASWELGRLFLAISIFGAVVSLGVLLARRTLGAAVEARLGYRPAVLEPSAGTPYAVAIAAGFLAVVGAH